jgi:hypothetical protein
MGARLRVFLTREEDRTLYEIRTATTVPQRVKDRAAVLRLSTQGWYVEKIATYSLPTQEIDRGTKAKMCSKVLNICSEFIRILTSSNFFSISAMVMFEGK